jgi:hypothetical protein
MTDSDTELDWSEWNEIQTYLESSERVYEGAIQTMVRVQNLVDEKYIVMYEGEDIEDAILRSHLIALDEMEHTGNISFSKRLLEIFERI